MSTGLPHLANRLRPLMKAIHHISSSYCSVFVSSEPPAVRIIQSNMLQPESSAHYVSWLDFHRSGTPHFVISSASIDFWRLRSYLLSEFQSTTNITPEQMGAEPLQKHRYGPNSGYDTQRVIHDRCRHRDRDPETFTHLTASAPAEALPDCVKRARHCTSSRRSDAAPSFRAKILRIRAYSGSLYRKFLEQYHIRDTTFDTHIYVSCGPPTVHLVLIAMSESSMDEEQFVQLFQYGLTNNYITVMAMSLFVYDFIISFDLEWRAVWSHKVTRATALYLALRYVTLANIITTIILFTISSCEGYFISSLWQVGTSCGIYLAEAAFASIRVYAIDGRQWTKAIIVMMLGLFPVAINIYGASKTFMYSTAGICSIQYTFSTSKSNTLLLVTRACILISNLLVVVSTWQAAHSNQTVGAWNSRGSLMAVLSRDGTIHFTLVVALNAADIAMSISSSNMGNIAVPVEYISAVVLCRFFLNLRSFSGSPEQNDSTVSSNGSSFSGFSSTIIGNLGEMFEEDPQAFDDEFDHELDERPGAGKSDSINCPPNSAKAPTTSRMATTASCRLDTHENPAADCEPLAAPDPSSNYYSMSIVAFRPYHVERPTVDGFCHQSKHGFNLAMLELTIDCTQRLNVIAARTYLAGKEKEKTLPLTLGGSHNIFLAKQSTSEEEIIGMTSRRMLVEIRARQHEKSKSASESEEMGEQCKTTQSSIRQLPVTEDTTPKERSVREVAALSSRQWALIFDMFFSRQTRTRTGRLQQEAGSGTAP
ncbi:predicted protein [Postia placenta Mad-698-R]|nr:predicted protein [Postia placenta Mad-698-R]